MDSLCKQLLTVIEDQQSVIEDQQSVIVDQQSVIVDLFNRCNELTKANEELKATKVKYLNPLAQGQPPRPRGRPRKIVVETKDETKDETKVETDDDTDDTDDTDETDEQSKDDFVIVPTADKRVNLDCCSEMTTLSKKNFEGRVQRFNFDKVKCDLSNLEDEVDRQYGHVSVATRRHYKLSCLKYLKEECGYDVGEKIQSAYNIKVSTKSISHDQTYSETVKTLKDYSDNLEYPVKERILYALYAHFPPVRNNVYNVTVFGTGDDLAVNYMDLQEKKFVINVDKKGSDGCQGRTLDISDEFIDWVTRNKVETKEGTPLISYKADKFARILKRVVAERPVQTLRHLFQTQQVNNGVSKEEFLEGCSKLGHGVYSGLVHYADQVDDDKFFHPLKGDSDQ